MTEKINRQMFFKTHNGTLLPAKFVVRKAPNDSLDFWVSLIQEDVNHPGGMPTLRVSADELTDGEGAPLADLAARFRDFEATQKEQNA